jgi:hypothetical protein
MAPRDAFIDARQSVIESVCATIAQNNAGHYMKNIDAYIR